jgi:erythromycin esterase-like protein
MARTELIRPLPATADAYDPLLELAAPARFVLIGEASHGTHEFYGERAEITKRLMPSTATRPSPPRPTGRTRTG